MLRRRYLPKIGAFWREIDAEGSRELESLQTGVSGRAEKGVEKIRLPDDEEGRHALALKVEDVLRGMGLPHGLLLRQLAWGDAWCDAALRAAMAHREKARREGVRVRVNYVTRQLPLTAEQQAQKDQLTQIMNDSLTQIQKLSSGDYTADAATQKVLDQWKEAQQKIVDSGFVTRTQQEEQTLAARGIGDSSAAQSVRRQRRLDQQSATQNLQNAEDEMGSQVRSQNLQLQQQLYNLAASGIDSKQAAAQAAAATSLSGSFAQDARRQASLLDYYNKSNSGGGYSVFNQSLQSGLGGGLSKVFGLPGTFLGTLFGNNNGRN
ncbi:MAG TPA: hypothetical protein VHP58_00555 [Alphaproteobacteria bacterium]|nr:hypothetical protein [Alphaproteobacteria bacterium]